MTSHRQTRKSRHRPESSHYESSHYEVVIDELIIHGPAVAGRSDHAAAVHRGIGRILAEQGIDGLRGQIEFSLPPE